MAEGGCIALWPEASPCSGHGECVHVNGSAYCLCDVGWNGNGDWSTRSDDCHINELATIIIWSIATFTAVSQFVAGAHRLHLWIVHRRSIPPTHALYAIYGSFRSMITKDIPFRITFCYTIHGLLLIPLNGSHLFPDGPRMASSWSITIGYCLSYYLLTILAHDQGLSSFMLHARLASNLTSIQDSLLRPIKIVAVAACSIVLIGFTVPLLACAVHDWQDIITRITISCGLAGSLLIAVCWSYYQWRIIQRLLSPSMTNTLNAAQRAERERAAKALRDYAVPAALNLFSNAAGMFVVVCWYWMRSRLIYWGAATTISFSVIALRSYKTYRPIRIQATQTIGVTPRTTFGANAPVVIAAAQAAAMADKIKDESTSSTAAAIAIAMGGIANSNRYAVTVGGDGERVTLERARSGTPTAGGLFGSSHHITFTNFNHTHTGSNGNGAMNGHTNTTGGNGNNTTTTTNGYDSISTSAGGLGLGIGLGASSAPLSRHLPTGTSNNGLNVTMTIMDSLSTGRPALSPAPSSARSTNRTTLSPLVTDRGPATGNGNGNGSSGNGHHSNGTIAMSPPASSVSAGSTSRPHYQRHSTPPVAITPLTAAGD